MHPSLVVSPTQQTQNTQNRSILARNIPSNPLQPNLNLHPSDTRYTVLPIVLGSNVSSCVSAPIYQPYDITRMFSPGTDMSPWSGYARNVHVESELRGQTYALQRCDQAVHVPASSDAMFSSSPPLSFLPSSPVDKTRKSLFNVSTR